LLALPLDINTMRSLFLVIVLTVIANAVNAQTTDVEEKQKPTWSVGSNIYYGGVFRYKPEMPVLEMTGLHGIELYANKITNGSKDWQSLFNYPQVGFAVEYYNYRVPDELGETYSASTYLDFTPTPKKKNQFRINIGTGIVYSTRKYDAVNNELNKAISSDISYILRGTIHYEIELSEQYYFNINAAFRHYSNGKLNMPNNGMNFPAFGLGVRYVPHPEKIKYYKNNESDEFDRSLKYNLMVSRSWREVWREDYKHAAYSTSFYLSKQVSKFNSILLGIDGFKYDQESVKREYINWVQDNPDLSEDYTPEYTEEQAAITIGTELFMDKLSVIVQGGFYIYKPQEYYESTWYQRYGLKYYPIEQAFAQITLKAHSRTADMVEFGIGLSL